MKAKTTIITACASAMILFGTIQIAYASNVRYIDGYYTNQESNPASFKYLNGLGKTFTSSSLTDEFPGYTKIVHGYLTATFDGITFTFKPQSLNWGPTELDQDGSIWRTSVTANKKITAQLASEIVYDLYTLFTAISVSGEESIMNLMSSTDLEEAFTLGNGNIQNGIYENQSEFPAYEGAFYPTMYNNKNQYIMISNGILMFSGKVSQFQPGVTLPNSVRSALEQWLLNC